MTRIAGEVADGFLCHAFTTEQWIREHTVPALAEGRRRVGKSMEGFTIKAAIFLPPARAPISKPRLRPSVRTSPSMRRHRRTGPCSTSTAGVTWVRT